MGYEVYMLIVEDWHDENHQYCSIIGHIDLCKIGDSQLLNVSPKKSYTKEEKEKINSLQNEMSYYKNILYTKHGEYCSGLDADEIGEYQEKISEIYKALDVYPHLYFRNVESADYVDCYGDPLVLLDLDDVLDALKEDYRREPYRRFKLAIDTLMSFTGPEWNRREIKIILFGH